MFIIRHQQIRFREARAGEPVEGVGIDGGEGDLVARGDGEPGVLEADDLEGGAAEEGPAAGRVCGVDSGLAAGDGDGAWGNFGSRDGEARETGEGIGEVACVGETGLEADGEDVVGLAGVEFDEFGDGEVEEIRGAGEVGSVIEHGDAMEAGGGGWRGGGVGESQEEFGDSIEEFVVGVGVADECEGAIGEDEVLDEGGVRGIERELEFEGLEAAGGFLFGIAMEEPGGLAQKFDGAHGAMMTVGARMSRGVGGRCGRGVMGMSGCVWGFVMWCAGVTTAVEQAAGVADVVRLRDGVVVRGEVLEDAPRGKVMVLARREWLREHAGERAEAWMRMERPWIEAARAERRERLESWRAERIAARGGDAGGAGDATVTWLDSQIAALREPGAGAESRLMIVILERSEVAGMERRPAGSRRLLRLGWRTGIADVETMEGEELREALAFRGLMVEGREVVRVADLLPVGREGEESWRLRRAATEWKLEPGGGLIQYGELVLPEEGGAGVAAGAMQALGQLSQMLRQLAEDPLGAGVPVDPLEAHRVAAARRGRISLVATRLELAPDFGGARVTKTLWVRGRDGVWRVGIERSAEASARDQGNLKGLEQDPQVQGAFGLLEGLGLGGVDGEMRQRSLAAGAAAQQALGSCRRAFEEAAGEWAMDAR